MNSSPLSAEHREHPWRLYGLQALVLLLTASIGAGFFFSTKILLQNRATERVKSMGAVLSYTLSQNPTTLNALHAPDKGPATAFLMELAGRIPQAQSVAVAEKISNRQEWIVRTSTDTTLNGKPIAVPPLPSETDVLRSTVTTTNDKVTAYVPLSDPHFKDAEILILTTDEKFTMALIMTLAPPFILLFLAGLFMARRVTSYASKGRHEMHQQIDANRLALLELATHQLGAPLATFRWWAELLADDDGDDLIHAPQVLEQIQEAVTRMDGIVKAMTEASHVEKQGMLYHVEVLKSLKHILQRIVDESRPELTRRKQKLEIHLDPTMQAVQIDTKLMYGVLQELITNAMCYSPDNSTITVRVAKEGKMAQIEVADQGYGIPEEDLIHIGEKFTRASNAAQHKPVGNGLGLFISKGIIENFGGELWVESKLDKGTTVYFTLPFDETKKEEIEDEPKRWYMGK